MLNPTADASHSRSRRATLEVTSGCGLAVNVRRPKPNRRLVLATRGEAKRKRPLPTKTFVRRRYVEANGG